MSDELERLLDGRAEVLVRSYQDGDETRIQMLGHHPEFGDVLSVGHPCKADWPEYVRAAVRLSLREFGEEVVRRCEEELDRAGHTYPEDGLYAQGFEYALVVVGQRIRSLFPSAFKESRDD